MNKAAVRTTVTARTTTSSAPSSHRRLTSMPPHYLIACWSPTQNHRPGWLMILASEIGMAGLSALQVAVAAA